MNFRLSLLVEVMSENVTDVDAIFRLVHMTTNFTISLQALTFLFHFVSHQQQLRDRYYQVSLYNECFLLPGSENYFFPLNISHFLIQLNDQHQGSSLISYCVTNWSFIPHLFCKLWNGIHLSIQTTTKVAALVRRLWKETTVRKIDYWRSLK